ncbi:MAG: inorganic diphosphatase, partial [Bryobacterales bacterium]|nr:inorganic diphosphatase [Bryobacterales bacterium]
DTLVAPDPATLHAASLLKTELATSFARLKDCDRVLYVAGQAPTPRHFRLVQGLLGSALRFGLTDEGDGTVTWESRLNDERTWYVCAGHGDLADLPEIERQRIEAFFRVYKDLPKGRNPVQLNGYGDAKEAKALIQASLERFAAQP